MNSMEIAVINNILLVIDWTLAAVLGWHLTMLFIEEKERRSHNVIRTFGYDEGIFTESTRERK